MRAVAKTEVGGIVGFRVVRAPYPLGIDAMGERCWLQQGEGRSRSSDRLRVLQRARPEICSITSCESPRTEMSVIPTARARCIPRIRQQYSASLLVVRPTYSQSKAFCRLTLGCVVLAKAGVGIKTATLATDSPASGVLYGSWHHSSGTEKLCLYFSTTMPQSMHFMTLKGFQRCL